MTMIEIGIVGAKKSGKTTLIETLIPALTKRGVRIATIKHTVHAHRFDTAGKDSFRHRDAGAVATFALSQGEMALYAGADERLMYRLIETLAEFCDVCLVEGDKDGDRPKVLLTNKLENIKGAIPGNIVASFGDTRFQEHLPHFGWIEVDSLTNFIMQFSKNAQRKSADYGK